MSPSIEEYLERQIDFQKQLGYCPRFENGWITDVKTWKKCEALAFQMIKADLDAGWQVDQASWGPPYFQYRRIQLGMSSWTVGFWVVYVLLGILTLGIGLIVLPFVMKRTFLELTGATIQLRRSIQARSHASVQAEQ